MIFRPSHQKWKTRNPYLPTTYYQHTHKINLPPHLPRNIMTPPTTQSQSPKCIVYLMYVHINPITLESVFLVCYTLPPDLFPPINPAISRSALSADKSSLILTF